MLLGDGAFRTPLMSWGTYKLADPATYVPGTLRKAPRGKIVLESIGFLRGRPFMPCGPAAEPDRSGPEI